MSLTRRAPVVKNLQCEILRTAEVSYFYLVSQLCCCEFYVMISVFSLGLYQQLASHGLFDVHVKATGDIHIDDHHTNEDVALAIGTVTTY